MKINITNKEYLILLDILYIADWIMHGFYTEDRVATKKYRDLEQKLFSLAKEFGADDLIKPDGKDGEFFATRKFEDESLALEYIEEYEEESFWDELIERLAERDLVHKYGPEIMKLIFEDEDIHDELENFKEKYAKEFEKNGLKNLRLS